ncbi:hypothetical protein C5B42_05430 [Candidatus Cerribacteria bacterium 'Amazon FNV 2010 28 9']|uniref:RNHCP domain-containing protein n=1 Tax=Candidatus Cerribacteria bacterium 'Amazon FNV 2010 28 9' TaxID=2081795 RepID=A0A317JMF3_9BACT|nr:MAG: hypothetical protein C5B42_05430 [Candidatus Cerribacteria bacterium 'Amazon FNV 2010 28 9']
MFITNNQEFVCEQCGKKVGKHPTSSRDHCTYCLYSKHVDVSPGDRQNRCQGLLQPIGLEIKEGKTQIVYQCISCGERKKNIVAPDDNQEMVLQLSTKPV